MGRIKFSFANVMSLIILSLKVMGVLKGFCTLLHDKRLNVLILNYLTESFQTTIAALGGLDIVVNNAGIMNDRLWELEVDVNLVSEIIQICFAQTILYFTMDY